MSGCILIILVCATVSFACYHPELPVIISGSEDGTVKIWNANTARLEQNLNYGLERAWCVAYQRGKQNVAVGFDEGMVVIKMGREEPAMSMDASGKIIFAKHTDIVTTTIKGVGKFCGKIVVYICLYLLTQVFPRKGPKGWREVNTADQGVGFHRSIPPNITAFSEWTIRGRLRRW